MFGSPGSLHYIYDVKIKVMLYEVHTIYDSGKDSLEIVYSKGAYSCNPKNIRSQVVTSFRYEYTHRTIPPHLFTNGKGEKYIVPTWQPVHPETTFEDIKWIRPETALKKQSFESTGSTGEKYKTVYNPNSKKWTCSCQGFFRVRDKSKGCKHIQTLKSKI